MQYILGKFCVAGISLEQYFIDFKKDKFPIFTLNSTQENGPTSTKESENADFLFDNNSIFSLDDVSHFLGRELYAELIRLGFLGPISGSDILEDISYGDDSDSESGDAETKKDKAEAEVFEENEWERVEKDFSDSDWEFV